MKRRSCWLSKRTKEKKRTNKTIVSLSLQNGTNIADAAAGELVVVQLVS